MDSSPTPEIEETEETLLARLNQMRNPKRRSRIIELVNGIDDTKKLDNLLHFIENKNCMPRLDKKLKH